MNPRAGTTGLLVFEARPFSRLGTPPRVCVRSTSIFLTLYNGDSKYIIIWSRRFFKLFPCEKFIFMLKFTYCMGENPGKSEIKGWRRAL